MAPIAGRLTADFPHHTCEQLFALALDIERYPTFIPWCRRARIVGEDEHGLMVDNHFGAGPVDAAFLTRALPEPPQRLKITSTDGPFSAFALTWNFQPRPEGGCRVVAEYRLELRSALVQAVARLAMPEAERKVLGRFRRRAEELYGT